MSDARPAVPAVDDALEILAKGGEQARRRLQRSLERADPSTLAPLREALVERLREERGRRVDDEGHPSSWTRSWQVCALAICAGEDRDALQLLESHLDRRSEANRWVRYWTLASACERSGLRSWALARARAVAVDSEESLLLRCLAWAILADRDDHAGACAALLWCLGDGDEPCPTAEGLAVEGLVRDDEARAAALRALRVIPLPQAFIRVQAIVDDAPFATHTCDAIWVMGKYRGAARSAEASQTLARFVVSHRRSREFYEMVGFAIRAIGNLGIAQTDLLLTELDSPSAGVFVEAAQALERLLGTDKAVDRLVDRQVEARGEEAKLANALRCMHRKEVVEALDRNLRCGVERREEAARLLFIELGGSMAIDRVQARRQDLESRRTAVSELDARQREHVKLIAVGDGAATWISVGMWVAVFLVGLVAVILGMILIFKEGVEAWTGWALSGGGGLFSLLGKLGFSGRMVETAGARAAARLAIFTGFQRRLQHIDLLLAQRFIDGATIDVGEVEVLSGLIGRAQVETQESLIALMPSEGEVEAYRRRRSLIGGDAGAAGEPPGKDV